MEKIIPDGWLSPHVLQKRIICHWTVTGYDPDPVSIDSYHIIIDGDGKLHRGSSDLDERAPHTYMFNSAVGLSLACMGGYQSPSNPGNYPPTKEQWEALVKCVKQLADQYNIPVTPTTVLMHGEVTANLLVDQWGKWDIGWLPHLGLSGSSICGDELRRRVLGENDDTLRVDVSVRVAGYSKVVTGMLLDSSTMVPVRAMDEAIKELEIVQVILNKQVELKYDSQKKTFRENLLVVNGVGYVSLNSLCNSIGWHTEVEAWKKDRRIVIAKPDEPEANATASLS